MHSLDRPRWLAAAFVALIAACLTLVAACSPERANMPAPAAQPRISASSAASPPPNVVFVLTDDLSWNLVQYMPHVRQLQREGVTFSNFTVTDSLCCPSRSSIFTGKFPHDTGVFTNQSPDGGFAVFHGRGDELQTFGTTLQANGYATAMMGKYLNGYVPTQTLGGAKPFVPPGWSEWDVAGKAYGEYNYNLNENHTVAHYGSKPADYLTDVLSSKGRAFIQRSAATHTPFAVEIAAFAPHSPSTPAKQDLGAFPGLTAPRTAAFDKLPSNAPSWLAGHPALISSEKAAIDIDFRKRAQSVQAVDRLIGNLRSTLQASGVADNTYIVFSSDNGFHMGEYRLAPGKQTAFDTDIRVPLVVVGPGVPAGKTRAEVVQNIDLAPTFESLAGADVPSDVDGHSLVPLLHGGAASDWRTASLIEHRGPDSAPNDPDAQTALQGTPTSYEALWTSRYTYVEYSSGEREYYDRAADPNELHNIAGHLSKSRLAALHSALMKLAKCHNQSDCWTASTTRARV